MAFHFQEILTLTQETDELIFGGDPDHCLDPGTFEGSFIIVR